MSKNKRLLSLTQFSMLLAIEAIVCFTPLGSLPAMGPIVATLGMVPVALTGILLGTGAGAAMGGFAGLFSFCVWTFAPPNPATAFMFTPFYSLGELQGNFWSIVICFVPRILVGVVASLVYRASARIMTTKGKPETLAFAIGGAAGSLVNTFGVLGLFCVFFGGVFAEFLGVGYKAVLLIAGGQVLTSGVPEAIICAVVAAAACGPVKKLVNSIQ